LVGSVDVAVGGDDVAGEGIGCGVEDRACGGMQCHEIVGLIVDTLYNINFAVVLERGLAGIILCCPLWESFELTGQSEPNIQKAGQVPQIPRTMLATSLERIALKATMGISSLCSVGGSDI
jgi:hypothetical protein